MLVLDPKSSSRIPGTGVIKKDLNKRGMFVVIFFFFGGGTFK